MKWRNLTFSYKLISI